MNQLTINSTPAERARGCTFAEQFEDASAVVRNGGEIVGSPEICNSLNCNAAGSVRYDSNGGAIRLGKSGTIFVRCRIDSDSGAVRIFGSDDSLGGNYEFRTYSDGSSLSVSFKTNTGIIITANIYGGGGSDVIPFSDEITFALAWVWTGSQTEITTYNNGSFRTSTTYGRYIETPDNYIAIGDWNGAYLDGEIFDVKFFDVALTDQEIADLHNETTYNYRNETSLYLPMGMSEHDPDNVQTLDISGNGNNAQFGDGVTSSTYPTKTRRVGYEFDGSQKMVISADPTLNQIEDLSIFLRFAVDSKCTFIGQWATDNFSFVAFLSAVTGILGFAITNNGSTGIEVESSTWEPLDDGREHVVSIVYEKAKDQVTFYIDSKFAGAKTFVTATGGIFNGAADTWVGDEENGSAGENLIGLLKDAILWPKALTPIQVLDLHINSLGKGGQL